MPVPIAIHHTADGTSPSGTHSGNRQAAAIGGTSCSRLKPIGAATALDRRAPDRVQERGEHDEGDFGCRHEAREHRSGAQGGSSGGSRGSTPGTACVRNPPVPAGSFRAFRGRVLGALAPGIMIRSGSLASIRSYLDLTKPRLLPMVLFTGIPVFGMAAGGWPSLGFGALVLLGISLAAASANTLNAYIERDKDALMERTKDRPLPAGRIEPGAALGFGLALAVASTRRALGKSRAAPRRALGVASILFYVFVYTIWLKPRSAWNAVIGGAAGAAAPLIADAAVNGHVGAGRPVAVRDRVLLATAARVGDRALSQGRLRGRRAFRCCRA